MIYYNDNDPSCVKWLHHLMNEKLIPEGVIDDRSIAEVRPGDLAGFTQCHFFAGIGGWPYALQLAEWGTDRPIWTASCPCQPFSVAGKKQGESDTRHLWPFLRDIVSECKPPVLVGEQVASPAGRTWLATVLAEMEAMGYAGSGADLCAAGISAPHIRQRLYWVGNAKGGGNIRQPGKGRERPGQDRGPGGRLAHTDEFSGRGDTPGKLRGSESERSANQVADTSTVGRMGHTIGEGLERHPGDEDRRDQSGRVEAQENGPAAETGPWDRVGWVACADGKSRPVESGIHPLVNGFPGRVDAIKGYGNAIVPQLAAKFLEAIK